MNSFRKKYNNTNPFHIFHKKKLNMLAMIDIVLLLALFSFTIIIIFTIYLLNSKEKRKIILKLPNHIQRDGIDQLQKANDPVFMKDPSIQFKQMNVRKAKLVNEEKQESQSHHRKGNNWQNNLNIPSSISNYGNRINVAFIGGNISYVSVVVASEKLFGIRYRQIGEFDF